MLIKTVLKKLLLLYFSKCKRDLVIYENTWKLQTWKLKVHHKKFVLYILLYFVYSCISRIIGIINIQTGTFR